MVTKREVTLADIVPAIYRAYEENYKIIFKKSDGTPINLYQYRNSYTAGSYDLEPVNIIDTKEKGADINETEIPGTADAVTGREAVTVRDYFIRRILYGDNGKFNDTIQNAPMGGHNLTKDDWCEAHLTKIEFDVTGLSGENIGSIGLFGKYGNKKFTEYLGVYYQEEKEGFSTIPEANKTEKRVITYVLNN